MNNNYKKLLKISCYVVLVIFSIRCLLSINELITNIVNKQFVKLVYSLIGYIGESIGVSTALMTLFNKHLWKVKLFNKISGSMPIMSNRYEGKITYRDDASKMHNRKAFMNIEQTFISCKISFKTDESESNSIYASIEEINNEKRLVYMYINEPKPEIRKNSPIHYGTAVLKICDGNISGEYYTSRNTNGSIEMKPIKKI